VKTEFEFWMGLGGFVFQVYPLYHNTKYICREYHVQPIPGTIPDAVISITDEDIEKEKKLSPDDWVRDEASSADVVGAYCEQNAVFRKIGDFISYHKASVFHGVLLELNGEGYLFTAKSGVGKSTHALNWLKAFPGAAIVNGDKPILRIEGDRVMGYGTPWCGKEHFQINKKVPVKAVILISRGEQNRIERRSSVQMLPVWLMQTHRPDDDMAMERMADTAIEMMDRVKLFSLRCNMEPESALIARQGIDQECRNEETQGETL